MDPDKKTWKIAHPEIGIEITLHAENSKHTPAARGIYCYYIYLHESRIPAERFAELWLEDKLEKWADTSPERVTHEYSSLPILEVVRFHGGCTFYDKRGHSAGHRCVVMGADFNHLWDHESPPSFEYVKGCALRTADDALAHLKSEKPQTA